MIIPRDHIRALLTGTLNHLLLPHTGNGTQPPHKPGTRLAIQPPPTPNPNGGPPKTKPATCHVNITRVREIRLGELTDTDARQLGHPNLDTLMTTWAKTRYWNEHAPAWLLEIRLDPDQPARLMHRDSTRGYTTNQAQAMHSEPEALDPTDLATVSRTAHEIARERYETLMRQRSRLPVEQRLTLVISDANRRGITFDRDLRVVEDLVRAMERRVYRPPHLRAA